MKYAGKIGFEVSRDAGTGLWEPVIEERFAYGDIVRDMRRNDDASKVIPDYTISTQFSLVADSYFYDHLEFLRYITFRGVKWEVSSVDAANYPRILVNVGKVYNGPEVEE